MIRITKALIAILLFTSCQSAPINSEQEKETTFSLPVHSTVFSDPIMELNLEQQSAFDALDEIQISGDGSNRLYSTFTNLYHPFYPPDTNVTIARSELLTSLNSFLKKHYKRFSSEERKEIAATAVLAQDQYNVFLCNANAANLNYKKGLPQEGVWVLPNVLGHRDIVIVWE